MKKNKGQTAANKARYEQILSQVTPAHTAIAKKVGKEDYTAEDLGCDSKPQLKNKHQIGSFNANVKIRCTIPEANETNKRWC